MTPAQSAYKATIARRTLPYGQRPTDLHVRIVFVMSCWQNANPSHVKLAKACHCSRRSIGNGLRRLRDLGLLAWTATWVRLRGGYVARGVNRYHFPSNSCLPPARAPRVKESRKEGIFVVRQSLPLCDRTAALQALARVRATMESRMMRIEP